VSIKKEFTLSVIANWTGTLIQYGLAFLITPIIVHSLGNNKYGIWSLAISLTGYYGIIDFGINSTAIKLFSDSYTKGDIKECNKIINTVMLIYILMTFVILTATFVIAIYSDVIFKIKKNNEYELLIIILIIGGNFASGFIFKIFNSVIISLRRFDINRSITITYTVLRSIFIILFLKMGYSLITMAIIVVCSDTLLNINIMFIAYRLFPGLKINLKNASIELLKKSYSFASYNFLIHTSRLIIDKSGQIIIGIFLGLEYIVYYSIAESLIKYTRKMPKDITTTLLPFVSHLNIKGDTYALKKFLYIVPKYVFSFSLFIFFLFFEYGKQIIELWMGNGFEQSYTLLILLMITELFVIVTSIHGQVFVSIGDNKAYAILSIFETVFTIILSIVLIYKWELLGIVIGNLIPISITRGIILPFLLNKTKIFSIKHYITKTLMPVFLSFILFIITYFALKKAFIINYNTITNLILCIIISSIIYAAISYFISFKELHLTRKK